MTDEQSSPYTVTAAQLSSDMSDLQNALDFIDGEAGGINAPNQYTAAALERPVRLGDGVEARYLGIADDKAFYYLEIPLIIMPRPGTVVRSVQIELTLFSGNMTNLPIIVDIFPSPKWQTLIDAQGNVQIGIDRLFKFVASAAHLIPGPAQMLAPILTLIVGAGVIDLPYEFLIHKPIIGTTTTGTNFVQWEFNGSHLFQLETPLKFGIILKMPVAHNQLTVKRSVQARVDNVGLKRLMQTDLERLERMRLAPNRNNAGIIERAIELFRNHLNKDWNISDTDLPDWTLSNDLRHLP